MKDISKAPFSSVIPPDTWKNKLKGCNSLQQIKTLKHSINLLNNNDRNYCDSPMSPAEVSSKNSSPKYLKTEHIET